MIHPGKHDFEAKNPGALFVVLSRAKSAGGEDVDPDFAFHEDVLINDDRFKPVDTPTTRARAVLRSNAFDLEEAKDQWLSLKLYCYDHKKHYKLKSG